MMWLFYRVMNFFLTLMRYRTFGVRALVIKKNQVLLVEHTYMEGWYSPGGGVDRRESPIHAIKRELWEEVGVELKSEPKLFSVYLNNVSGRDDYVAFYICNDFVEHQRKCEAEIKRKEWYDINNLPNGIASSNKRRIEEYLGKRKISDRW